MFQTILVAVDGSEHARRAVEIASDLAEKYGASLHLLSVFRPTRLQESTHSLVRTNRSLEPQHSDDELQEIAEELLQGAEAEARKHEIRQIGSQVKRGHPARTIVATAEELGADLIVLGSRGLGDVSGLLLGSVSHKVASLAKCNVITVK
jgi:nucleotide-binding universal stress UspA family protein